MRKAIYLLSIFALFALVPAMAQSFEDLGNDNSAFGDEKLPDTGEYQVTSRADSIGGDLDGTNTYDRVWDITNTGACSADSSDSSNDGVSYEVFDVFTNTTEFADIEVALGGLGDSYLYIYCDGFDPANPMNNLIFGDDDGGVGFGSAITPAAEITMEANVQYQIVVAGWGNADAGTYTINLGGNAVFGEPVTIPTLGEWGLIAFVSILAMAGAVMARRRRLA